MKGFFGALRQPRASLAILFCLFLSCAAPAAEPKSAPVPWTQELRSSVYGECFQDTRNDAVLCSCFVPVLEFLAPDASKISRAAVQAALNVCRPQA